MHFAIYRIWMQGEIDDVIQYMKTLQNEYIWILFSKLKVRIRFYIIIYDRSHDRA